MKCFVKCHWSCLDLYFLCFKSRLRALTSHRMNWLIPIDKGLSNILLTGTEGSPVMILLLQLLHCATSFYHRAQVPGMKRNINSEAGSCYYWQLYAWRIFQNYLTDISYYFKYICIYSNHHRLKNSESILDIARQSFTGFFPSWGLSLVVTGVGAILRTDHWAAYLLAWEPSLVFMSERPGSSVATSMEYLSYSFLHF